MTSARTAAHTPKETTPHTPRTPRTDRTDRPPTTITERHAMSTTTYPASRADDRSEHSSRDARSLTGDVASMLMPPGDAAGIKETPHPIAHRGLRGWAARRPVTSFLILLFTLAYPVMSLPVLAAHGVIPDGWMPQLPGLDTERIAAAMLVFLALLPTTFLVTWAVDGRPGVLRLVRRMFRWRIGARWWLIVLAGLPTLTMALALLVTTWHRSMYCPSQSPRASGSSSISCSSTCGKRPPGPVSSRPGSNGGTDFPSPQS